MKVSGIITLTTDFGIKDPYVGIMKGVILSINPNARIIDISHHIKAGSVLHAATSLVEAYHYFPKGTVHIAVVDPGVGSDRRPILVKAKNYLFVGPDNGLFWPIITTQEDIKIIHLTKTEYFLRDVSATFHGRDVFAPVAAHVSGGVDPLQMGPSIDDPVPLIQRSPQQTAESLCGEVIRVDHFGNLITNIHRKDLDQFLGKNRPVIRVGNQMIKGIHQTYGNAGPNELLALIGSSGFLEIAVNLGRASEQVSISSGGHTGMEIKVSKE
jgi:S-adenosylmethionine hydrolase